MHKIIGIDPGSRVAGYGVISIGSGDPVHLAHGVIKLPGNAPLEERLHLLALSLQKLYELHQPDSTVIEKIFLGKSAESAFRLGHARGICMQKAFAADSKVYEYAARTVKKAVVGSGAASKEQVGLLVCGMLRIQTNAPLDATDALALAICHSRKQQGESVLQKALKEMTP